MNKVVMRFHKPKIGLKGRKNYGVLTAARKAGTAVLVVIAALAGGGVAAQTDGASAARLSRCWEHDLPLSERTPAVLSNGHIILGSKTGTLVELDMITGSIDWSSEIGGRFSSLIKSSSGDLLAITVRKNDNGTNAELRALSRTTGLTIWKADIDNRSVFFLTEADGNISVLSPDRGFSIFRLSTGSPLGIVDGGEAVTEPVEADGTILYGTKPENIREYDPLTRKVLVSHDVGLTPTIVAFASSGNALIADRTGRLIAVKRKNAARLWEFRAGGRIVDIKPLANGTALIVSDDNFAYLMSSAYGNILWKRRLPGRVLNSSVLDDETKAVFTVIGERAAYVLDLEDGRVVDKLLLEADEDFLKGSVWAYGGSVLIGTTRGLAFYSPECRK